MAVLAIEPADEPAVNLRAIKAAAAKLEGAILRTPAVEAPKLSALFGAQVFMKYENMQATGSFKERGALLKLLSLDDAARARCQGAYRFDIGAVLVAQRQDK